MILSESYKDRLKRLAGIVFPGLIKEATEKEKNQAFAASDTRVPFSQDLMKTAIKQGREIGLLFKSKNEKYEMPVSKYRIIYPVALGISKAGNQVVRGLHKLGQSEKEAIRTGIRSAEVENEWRLFKTSNIKGMWFTGNFFRGPIEGYNADDKGMTVVHVATNFNEVRRFQEKLFKQLKAEKERKRVLKTFKTVGERPIEEPISSPKVNEKGLGKEPEATEEK